MEGIEFVLLPIGLGLLGFIEPCTIGSSLLFIQYLERASASEKIVQALVFTATRALMIGSLGAMAAMVGSAFSGFQQAAWILLGAIYVVIGALYASGRSGAVMRRLGPGLKQIAGARGSAALALLFGLNVPACAAPLLVAMLGAAAAGGSGGIATIATGFVSLTLFGLALSLPLALAVLWPRARRGLERFVAMGWKMPVTTGLVFVALGAWSMYVGLTVDPRG